MVVVDAHGLAGLDKWDVTDVDVYIHYASHSFRTLNAAALLILLS